MSSNLNKAIVVQVSLDCKALSVFQEYPHPGPVFGVAWSPFVERQFITACRDGIVRMFDTTTS
jgi:WD40 repeat protein